MIFRGVIEKKLNKLLKNKINEKKELTKFGTLQDFKINLKKRKIALSLLLKGEYYPIKIEIKKFFIKRKQGEWYLIIDDITSNKEWINMIIKEFLNENYKKIKLPKKLGQIANAYLKL